MSKTMRKLISLLLACLLTLLLACGSFASAEGLMEAMIDSALRAGRAIEVTFRVDAEFLLSILEMSMDPSDPNSDVMATAISLLKNGLVRVRYSQVGEQMVVNAALELNGTPQMTADIWTQGEELLLATNLLPGRAFAMAVPDIAAGDGSPSTAAPEDALLALGADTVDRYVDTFQEWLKNNPETITIQRVPTAATQTRDAAATSIALRTTDAKLLLLLNLLSGTFMKDEALIELLAPQFDMAKENMRTLPQHFLNMLSMPRYQPIEATLFLGDQNQIVGMDAAIQPPTMSPPDAPAPLVGSLVYDHRSTDANHTNDAYTASFTWGAGSLLDMKGTIQHAMEPILETYDHALSFNFTQAAETPAGVDETQMLMMSMDIAADMKLSSKTEVVLPDDFLTQIALTIEAMGMGATVHMTIGSVQHTPVTHPSAAIQKLDAIEAEEMAALTQELTDNLGKALSGTSIPSSPAVNPPAVLPGAPSTNALKSYSVDDESIASIDSVVGAREVTNQEVGITEGKPYVYVGYKSSAVLSDLQAYVNVLIADNWVAVKLEGDLSNGIVQLANESIHEGKLLMSTMEYTPEGYTVLTHRTSGTLERYTDADGNKMGVLTLE